MNPRDPYSLEDTVRAVVEGLRHLETNAPAGGKVTVYRNADGRYKVKVSFDR